MVYSFTVFIHHVKTALSENVTINDVFVVNVAEGRGRFATQLGVFNDYTADLALDGDTNDDVNTPPHCAYSVASSGSSAWWMVDLGKQYIIDSVTIYGSHGNASMLLRRS